MLKWILSSLLLLGSCSPSFAGGSVFGVTVVTGGVGSTIQADNDDIRFASGTTVLNHYIYERTSNGTATVWVKFPTLAPGTNSQYYFYYNNATAIDTGSFSITFTKNYQETGLGGLWHFDEGAGTTTADSSGNTNTATLVGGPAWQTTDGGQWDGTTTTFNTGSHLNFVAASSQYVDTNPEFATENLAGMLSGASPFTIVAWIKRNTTAVGRAIAYGIRPANYQNGTMVWIGFPNTTEVRITDYGSAVGVNAPITLGAWTQVVYRCNGTTASLFVNGSYIGDYTPVGGFNITPSDLWVGGTWHAGEYTDISADEVRIYNRALPLAEIQALYERRRFSASAVTVTYGTEETGSWALDNVTFSNRRPLTINNSGATTLTDFQLKFQFNVGALGINVLNQN